MSVVVVDCVLADSGAPKWANGDMDEVDLTMLGPHIEQHPSLQELEIQILDFKFLQVFYNQVPPHVVYSIPDYLSIIKNSVCVYFKSFWLSSWPFTPLLQRLENAESIYRKLEDVFLKHLEAELTRYCETPRLDFFLLHLYRNELSIDYRQHQPRRDHFNFTGSLSLTHDSLSLQASSTRNISSAYAYTDALRSASKGLISEETVAHAALYALKEASVLLARHIFSETIVFIAVEVRTN